jgi:hypothetical protein
VQIEVLEDIDANQLLQQLTSLSDLYWADSEGRMLNQPLIKKVQRATADSYLADRDRVSSHVLDYWRDGTYEFMAKQMQFSKSGFAKRAKKVRLWADKIWHGRNRAKGFADAAERDEAQKCIACQGKDSLTHLLFECNGDVSITKERHATTHLFKAFINNSIRTLHSALVPTLGRFRDMAMEMGTPDAINIWLGRWSSSQIQRLLQGISLTPAEVKQLRKHMLKAGSILVEGMHNIVSSRQKFIMSIEDPQHHKKAQDKRDVQRANQISLTNPNSSTTNMRQTEITHFFLARSPPPSGTRDSRLPQSNWNVVSRKSRAKKQRPDVKHFQSPLKDPYSSLIEENENYFSPLSSSSLNDSDDSEGDDSAQDSANLPNHTRRRKKKTSRLWKAAHKNSSLSSFRSSQLQPSSLSSKSGINLLKPSDSHQTSTSHSQPMLPSSSSSSQLGTSHDGSPTLGNPQSCDQQYPPNPEKQSAPLAPPDHPKFASSSPTSTLVAMPCNLFNVHLSVVVAGSSVVVGNLNAGLLPDPWPDRHTNHSDFIPDPSPLSPHALSSSNRIDSTTDTRSQQNTRTPPDIHPKATRHK